MPSNHTVCPGASSCQSHAAARVQQRTFANVKRTDYGVGSLRGWIKGGKDPPKCRPLLCWVSEALRTLYNYDPIGYLEQLNPFDN